MLQQSNRPIRGGIPKCNLYGQKDPGEIWEALGRDGTNLIMEKQKDLYVFTKLKKKTANGSRVDCMIGTGAWKGKDTGVKTYWNEKNAGTTTLLGMRKRFHNKGRSSSVDDRRWIMYEYSLDASMPVHGEVNKLLLH